MTPSSRRKFRLFWPDLFQLATVGLWRGATRTIGPSLTVHHRRRRFNGAPAASPLKADVAEKLDLSLLAVSNIERGESIPSLETFAALVELLKLDVGALLPVPTRKKSPSRVRARVDAEIAVLLDTLNDRDAALLLDIGPAVARQGRR